MKPLDFKKFRKTPLFKSVESLLNKDCKADVEMGEYVVEAKEPPIFYIRILEMGTDVEYRFRQFSDNNINDFRVFEYSNEDMNLEYKMNKPKRNFGIFDCNKPIPILTKLAIKSEVIRLCYGDIDEDEARKLRLI